MYLPTLAFPWTTNYLDKASLQTSWNLFWVNQLSRMDRQMFAIFSPDALYNFLESGRICGHKPPESSGSIDDDTYVIVTERGSFFYTRTDTETSPVIYLSLEVWHEFTDP